MTTPNDGAALYAEKMQRVMDAVALRQPDRVPIAFQATFWLARYGGISYRQLMYDYDKACEITRRALLEFDPDLFYPVHATTLGPLSEAIGFKQIQWPGHGVGDNQPFQYIDREYMTADEYDDFIFDPTGFYLDKYLPRIATAFEGIEELPKFAGLYYHRLVASMRSFANPGGRAGRPCCSSSSTATRRPPPACASRLPRRWPRISSISTPTSPPPSPCQGTRRGCSRTGAVHLAPAAISCWVRNGPAMSAISAPSSIS